MAEEKVTHSDDESDKKGEIVKWYMYYHKMGNH